MNKILGIDYGTVRVGLAITDALGITSQSMDTLTINNDDNILIDKLDEIIQKEKVNEIVIGYPKHLNGDKSETAEKIDKIIEILESKNIKVIKWDERLTTVMAYKTMRDLNIKQKDKNKHADRLAAQYILEDYLKSKG